MNSQSQINIELKLALRDEIKLEPPQLNPESFIKFKDD
jgi:hypothetical protein